MRKPLLRIGHEWVTDELSTRCKRCLALAKLDAAGQPLDVQQCVGRLAYLRADGSHDWHPVAVASSGCCCGAICMSCGCWVGFKVAEVAAAPCRGSAGLLVGRRRGLRRALDGLHPNEQQHRHV